MTAMTSIRRFLPYRELESRRDVVTVRDTLAPYNNDIVIAELSPTAASLRA